MKKSLRNLLVLLAILVLGGVIYFIASLFKKNETFVSNRPNLSNNEQFTRNENNVNIFKNISREVARNYGISQETYDAMINVFNNNEPPAKFAEILKNKPDEAAAVGKLMLDNTNK
jgi:hypothetical protein